MKRKQRGVSADAANRDVRPLAEDTTTGDVLRLAGHEKWNRSNSSSPMIPVIQPIQTCVTPLAPTFADVDVAATWLQEHDEVACKDRELLLEFIDLFGKPAARGDQVLWHNMVHRWNIVGAEKIDRQVKVEGSNWKNRKLADIKHDAKSVVLKSIQELAAAPKNIMPDAAHSGSMMPTLWQHRRQQKRRRTLRQHRRQQKRRRNRLHTIPGLAINPSNLLDDSPPKSPDIDVKQETRVPNNVDSKEDEYIAPWAIGQVNELTAMEKGNLEANVKKGWQYASDCSGGDAAKLALDQVLRAAKKAGVEVGPGTHEFISEIPGPKGDGQRRFLRLNHRIKIEFDDCTARDVKGKVCGGGAAAVPDHLDVYSAGSVCVDLSNMSTNGKPLEEDLSENSGQSTTTLHAAMKLIEIVRPRVVIFENVYKKAAMLVTIKLLERVGNQCYGTLAWILNSRFFKVITSRTRMYIIGINCRKVEVKMVENHST